MDRERAVTLVASTIAAHRGITHLRLTTQGSFTGAVSLTVQALARPASGRRERGTREIFLDIRNDARTWMDVFAALDPTISVSGGCADRSGFDVDVHGAVTNRHGVNR